MSENFTSHYRTSICWLHTSIMDRAVSVPPIPLSLNFNTENPSQMVLKIEFSISAI
jgi:hypothetical protein